MQELVQLRDNIQRVFFGHPAAVDQLMTCLLARGHVLIEDVPGVGKTMLATALARSLDCAMNRVQLTPDLLPSDILGVTVWDQNAREFVFKPGPIFANVVLADEINRTTPRTQSALLEAMNEAQVSIDGHTRPLAQPFIVVATQNPFEFEGTYFLPENQLDRFLMRIKLGYPEPEDELRILQTEPDRRTLQQLKPVLKQDQIISIQERVDHITVDSSILDYVVRLADATRKHDQLQVGVSPRGTLSLLRAARATAVLAQRDYATVDDVVDNVMPVWSHRVITRTYMRDGDNLGSDRVMQHILETVPVPE